MLHESSREGSERTGEKRVGAPSGAKSARTSAGAEDGGLRERGRRGTVVTSSFLPGGARGIGRTDPVNRGSRGQNGTRCPPPPTLAVGRPWRADMRDIGAPGVPLPGFLCASADRPKRLYGTSSRSPRKARPARFFTAKWHYRCASRFLAARLAPENAKILMRRNEMTRWRLIMKREKYIYIREAELRWNADSVRTFSLDV